MKGFLIGVAVAIVLILVLVVGTALDLIGHTANEATKAYKQTVTADKAISNYEWFEQQYKDIQAQDEKIANAKSAVDDFAVVAGPRDKWTFQDKEQYSILFNDLKGLKEKRTSMVSEYNAKSRMITRKMWKSDSLPYEIQ